MNNRFVSFLRLSLLAILVTALALQPQYPAYALTTLTVEPITWNVIGLDSNDVSVGPNHFPIGARVCNTGTETATNVTATWNWIGTHTYINLRLGTLNPAINLGTLNANTCADAYFEVEVTRNASAYDTTATYRIDVTAGNVTGTISTPTPRELYVEHLISQNRNYVRDIKLNGVSIPAGGTMTLMVGQTYDITINGSTATQGYNQLEEFINFPNTIFQVVSVSTTYSANNSPYTELDWLYGDACLWDNDPGSPNYRSCLGGDYKNGGNVDITYTVKILKVPGAPLVNPEPLSTLIYDFSGSSYHYNADYGVSTRYANIVNATMTKSFQPKIITAGGTSTMTFTIQNPGPDAMSNVRFDDGPFPAGLTLTTTPTPTVSYSGCGSPTPAAGNLTAGATSLSFSGITVAGNSSCTITVSSVTASTDGNYTNTTGRLFINTTDDTGSFGSDTLVVSSKPSPPTSCGATPSTLATWDFTNYIAATSANNGPFNEVSRASDVSDANTIATYIASGASVSAIVNPTTVPGGWSAPASSGNVGDSWGIRSGWLAGNPAAGTEATVTSPFYQFQVDASQYGGMGLAASYNLGGNWSNAGNLYVLVSTDGTSWSLLGTKVWDKGNAWVLSTNATNGINLASTLTGVSTVYFRVYSAGAQNDTAVMYLDSIRIFGCSRTNADPTLSKSFLTSPIQQGNNSVLQFILTNPNASSLTGVGFSDTLPTGLLIATSNGLTTACTTGTLTGGTTTAASGTTLISLSGATLSANANCTISVNVLGNVAGSYTNTSSPITSTQTGPNITSAGYGTSPLTVIAPPTMVKSFNKSSILANDTSTMSFTITNPNTTTALTGIGFTDSGAGWPAGMTVATSGPTSTCGGTLSTISPNSLTFSGGSLAAGISCTFSVTVTGTTAGTKTNTTSTITATGGGLSLTGSAASATLDVNDPVSLIGLSKQISTDNINWVKYIGLTPTQNIWYKFSISNDGETTLNGISVTDPSYILTSCAPALPTSLAVGASASCVLGPISVTTAPTPNPFINTATVTNTTYTPATPITSTAKYGTKSLSIVKNATESFFTAAGNILHYSFTVTNNGGYPLLGPVTVTDDKIGAVACQDPTAVGDLDSYLDPGEAVTCPASGMVTYTVLASDVTAMLVTNTAHGSADGINSPDTSKTVPLAALTIDKDTTTPSIDINGNVAYTIVVANTGQVDLTNFQVSDVLPTFGGTSAVLSVMAPGYTVNGTYTGTAPNTDLLAGTDTLVAGATATVTVTVDLVNATAGTYDNTATVTTTQTGSIDDDGLTAGDSGTPSLAADPETDEDVVVFVQPDLTVIKTNNTANGWTTSGGTFQWTITARNGATAGTATFANTDVILSDTLPAGQTYGSVTVTNGMPAPTGTIYCSITGTALSCVASGGPVTMPANASFNVVFNVTTAGTANLPNTATVDPGNKVPESNEENNTGSNTVSVFDAQPSKLLVTTSEPETSASRVAIGEMVRYRIVARIPEGSFTNFQLVDNIPSGLQFLNDGTARFAFVSNGGGVTSSTLACANDTGSTFDLVSLPTANVDCTFTGGISGGTGDGVAVTFSLGNLTNSDSDADAEYVVIELNSLVLNVNTSTDINQGTNNQNGANNPNFRLNDTTLRVNNTTVGGNSANVSVNVAEPAIVNVAKSISAGPYIPGNSITYTLTFSNVPSTNTNAATAFDIVLTDALNANLTPGAVNVSSTQTTPCAGGTAFTTSSSTTGQNVTVNVSCLDPDKTVTVTIGATINTATTGGTNISNTGGVTYTSLPGAQGNCAAAPFTCTGVGGSGSGTGERNGFGGAGPDTGVGAVLNNYADLGTASFTVQAGTITIEKQTLPDASTQNFTFTPTYNGGTPFNLTDNGTNGSGNITPGTYTVVESSVAGWTLTGLSCVGDTDNGSTLTIGTGTAQIDLDSAENITCTFTNTKQPTLTLQKTVVNDNGGTAVDTAWTLNATQGATTISGVEGDAAVTNALVSTGTWTLSETGGPAGYTAGIWSCTGAADANPNDGLTLAAGETVTCSITNNDNAPSLILVKTVTNDNSGTNVATDWTLTATGASGAPTSLSGTTPVTSGAGFIADTYTLAETGPAGYTASVWSCTNGVTVTAGQITLGLGQSTTCTINNNDNDLLPVANSDTNTAMEGGPAVNGNVRDGGVSAGDVADNQGDPTAAVTASSQGANPITIGSAFTTAAGGTLTLNATGTYSYTPPATLPEGGPLTEVFNYTITDADGDTSSTTLTITVDRLPQANPDTNSATEGGADATGNVITNDDEGNVNAAVTAAGQGANPITIGTPFTTSAGGTLTLNANGGYTYTPPASLPEGGALTEVFNYIITDNDGDTSSSTLTITVDRLPQANPDTNAAVGSGPAVTGNTITNDDEGNVNATVTGADQGGTAITMGIPFTTSGGGTLTLNADGSYSYTPPAAGSVPPGGLTEVFNYTITDADGDTSSSTLTITVTVTLTITANNDSATTPANTPVTTVVTTNDTSVAGSIDPNSVTVITPPATGTVVCTGANCVYTPPAGFTGTVTYTYQVCLAAPNGSTCATAVVTINVTPTIDAVDDDYSASSINGGSGGITASVIDNDTTNNVAAVIGTNVTLTPGTAPTPAAGSITMNANGTITVAAGTTAGTYTYPYTICTDPATLPAICDTATATIKVTAAAIDAVNDDYSSTPINSTVGGNVGNAFTNDTLNGAPIVIAQITPTIITPASDPGVTLNLVSGSVDVAAGTPAGTYTIIYQICENINPTNCDTAAITVVVSPPASIGGVVFHDTNVDGSKSGSEAGLSGVTVNLYDSTGTTLIATTTTGPAGIYTFPNLAPGSYQVVEIDPAGYVSSTANNVPVTVVAGAAGTANFGDYQLPNTALSSISGVVFNDANGNGTQDASELPISGVTVELKNNLGTVIGTVVTGTTGTYTFPNLPAGTYTVTETDLAGYMSTTLNTVVVNLSAGTNASVNYGDQLSAAVIADPAVTKFGTPTNAVVGDTIVYTITVGNNGNANAVNVTLTDTKPAFLDLVAITISPNPGLVPVIAGNTFTINFGTVTPTDLYTVTVLTRVNALGVPPGGANTVQIASASATDRLFNNISAAGLTITAATTNPPSPSSAMPATGFAPDVVTEIMPQPKELQYAATDVVLEIPSLGIKLPIVGVPKKNGAWDVTWLGKQAGWLEGTAFPSWDGNSVLTGHVYLSDGLPGPFVSLGKLKYGDKIVVHAYGQKYIFEVRTNAVVEPNDTSAFKHEEQSWLTLVTCKEYDERTNTYKKRIVVRAVLVKAEAE